MTTIFFALIFLAVSRFGKIKLGPDHSTPDYSNSAWFSMLFANRNGYRLNVFWRWRAFDLIFSSTSWRARDLLIPLKAYEYHLFHWGFNVWAIYGMEGE